MSFMKKSIKGKDQKKAAAEAAAAAEEAKKKPEPKNKSKTRHHPLLDAKTDAYVDDSELFLPKLTRKERQEYWLQIVGNRGKRQPPPGFKSFIAKAMAKDTEIFNYPKVYTILLHVTTSQNWDQRTLNSFLLFLILVVFIYDGYAEKYAPTLVTMNGDSNSIIVLPLIAMLLCQIIPAWGAFYLTHYCNDLILYAASNNFQQWAFNAALMAQIIEFYFYGGRDRREFAGNCRFDHAPNKNTLFEKIGTFVTKLRRKHAKIHADDDGDVEEGGDEEEEEESQQSEDSKNDDFVLKGKRRMSLASSVDTSQENMTANNSNSGMTSGVENSLTGYKKHGDVEVPREPDEEGVEYMDWTCLVCKRENHQKRHPVIDTEVYFGTKGNFYKRTYAFMVPRKDMPSCTKCFTYADYKPPISSAHTFPNNPKPYIAFEEYPKPFIVPAGLAIDEWSMRWNRFRSFFLGLRESVDSMPVLNDWRLKKFVMDRYPMIPRQTLPEGEYYVLGEIVECKQQKFEFCRARILKVNNNHTYDIRYDGGDELRFVLESSIRLRPEKRSYAYKVELCMIAIAILLPLGLILGMTGAPGAIFLGPLLVSIWLLVLRLISFVQYMYNYYDAGLWKIGVTTLVYTLPVLFLMITSVIAIGISDPNSPDWIGVAVMFILTMIFSLPVLYMMRPSYALFGLIIFIQFAVGLYTLAQEMNGQFIGGMVAQALAPFFTLTITLKIIRRNLHAIWDVCLVIRPERDISIENPSIINKVKEDIQDLLNL